MTKQVSPVPLPVALYRIAQRQVERKPPQLEPTPIKKAVPPRNSVTAGRKIDLLI
ncbi:MAG: hypothetical protein ISR91_06980 [Candidatus Delongbacteria bacterium]|nr:hypothetical protein [Candidatus Delongbacteria bacterium]